MGMLTTPADHSQMSRPQVTTEPEELAVHRLRCAGGWCSLLVGVLRIVTEDVLVEARHRRRNSTGPRQSVAYWDSSLAFREPTKRKAASERETPPPRHDLMCFCELDQPCHADVLL